MEGPIPRSGEQNKLVVNDVVSCPNLDYPGYIKTGCEIDWLGGLTIDTYGNG